VPAYQPICTDSLAGRSQLYPPSQGLWIWVQTAINVCTKLRARWEDLYSKIAYWIRYIHVSVRVSLNLIDHGKKNSTKMAKTQNILTFSSNIPWQRKLSTQCLKLIFISSEKFCFIYFNFFSCWRTVQPASDLWLPLYPAIPAAQSSSAQVNMSASFVISLLSDVTYQCHLSSVALYGDWTVSFKPLALCPAIWWGQSPSAQVNMSVLICHQSSVSWRMSVSHYMYRTMTATVPCYNCSYSRFLLR
jgi:hypothetical protein